MLHDFRLIEGKLTAGNVSASSMAAVLAERAVQPSNVTHISTWGDGLWFIKTVALELPSTRNVALRAFFYRLGDYIKNDLVSTVFRGQLISVGVVVTFLGIFFLREWVIQNGPIDNPAPDAPEMGGPPGPQDFRPEMAVRWRRRRPVTGRRIREARLDREEQREAGQRWLAQEAVAVWPMDAPRQPNNQRQEDPEVIVEDDRADGGDDDQDWVDEPDEMSTVMDVEEGPEGSAFPREVDNTSEDDLDRVDAHVPLDTQVDRSDTTPGDVNAVRDARNRYFSVADHNRHFADQTPETINQNLNRAPRQTYQSPFAFDFNIDETNRQGAAHEQAPQGSGSAAAELEHALAEFQTQLDNFAARERAMQGDDQAHGAYDDTVGPLNPGLRGVAGQGDATGDVADVRNAERVRLPRRNRFDDLPLEAIDGVRRPRHENDAVQPRQGQPFVRPARLNRPMVPEEDVIIQGAEERWDQDVEEEDPEGGAFIVEAEMEGILEGELQTWLAYSTSD